MTTKSHIKRVLTLSLCVGILIAVFLSTTAGAAVISVNIESQKTGEVYNPRFGDITGSYVTGTDTEWNVLNAGDADGYAYRATTGVLGTMDGSATQNDVKFTIVGSEGKVGRLWAQQDYIFCQDGGSNKIDAYEFSYTGLVAGQSYDLLFKCNRNYSQVTIDGVTKVPIFSTGVLTFNGAIADASGGIAGDLRENTNPSVTNANDKLYWMQIQGEFSVYIPPQPVERPMINANASDKIRVQGLVDTYDWAENCFNQLQANMADQIQTHQASPANFLASAPVFKDSSASVVGSGIYSHVSFAENAMKAGILYFMTDQEEYAQYAADVINYCVQELGYEDRTPEASSDGDQRDYRDVYEKIARCYDYIRPFLVKDGTTVYDSASATRIPFDDTKAQIMFINIVERGFKVSSGGTNITIMEADSIFYSALCIEDAITRDAYVNTFINRSGAGLKWMKEVLVDNGGIWPESSSYNGLGNAVPVFMEIVDRLYPEYNIFDGFEDALNGALDRVFYMYPSEEEEVCFGDSHRELESPMRSGDIHIPVLRRVSTRDRYRDSFDGVVQRYCGQIKTDREKYGYNPGDLWAMDPLDGYEANSEVTQAVVHNYAGLVIQENLNCTDKKQNGMKYYQGGASYVHCHLTGIDLELFGAGVVMGPVAGSYPPEDRGLSIFINYYRRYAGHNTVVVNGESLGLTNSWKGYNYNSMNTVMLDAMEPEPYATPVSDWFTFSCQTLDDTASDALQQRTVGIVRTGDTSGYYIDLFRSRHDNDNRYHDYIYHNIGDNLSLTRSGAAIPLQADTQVDKQYVDPRDSENPDIFDYQDWTHFPSVPMMPIGSSNNYLLLFPGWNYFEDVAYSAQISDPVVGRFDLNTDNTDRHMYVNIPGGVGREYTAAKAPTILEGAGSYGNKPAQVLSIRQNGEAWDRPFVVVFEPSTNESPTVQSVEHIMDNDKIIGTKVVSIVGSQIITDLIIAQESQDVTFINEDEQIEFIGRYAVARTIDNVFGRQVHLYIGDGQSLSFKGLTLIADDDNSEYQSYIAGNSSGDMITWSGEGVELAPRSGNNDNTQLFWTWSADPADGVEFSPNAWVENPTVTITKPTDNPSVVTVSVVANDGTGPLTDTMTIDVYDDACKAAIGAGVGADYPADLVEDCFINIEDLAVLAADWLVGSDIADFADIASMWLVDYSLEGAVSK